MKSFKQFTDFKKIKDFDDDKDMKSLSSRHFQILKLNDYGKPILKRTGHPYLYHATSESHARNILKNGIKKSGISFTGNPYEAADYARQRSESSNEHGVILKVHKDAINDRHIEFNDSGGDRDLFYKGSIDTKQITVHGYLPKK